MKITGKTGLVGVIGWPVAHSASPAMHNAAATALGLDLVYVPMPVRPERLEAAVRGLAALGFRGVNVTVPHKEGVMRLLDVIDPAAEAIGAVNTILFRQSAANGQLSAIGYNTDWTGFLADLWSHGVDPAGQRCLVLGAGGSARAVAYALASSGGRVSVLARRVNQAERLVRDLLPYLSADSLSTYPLAELATLSSQLTPGIIINATPVGMVPDTDATPWPKGITFPPGAFVYDLVYNPVETKLVQLARAAGCQAVTGLGMLVRQGAEAFKLWTGVEPDVGVMMAALDL